MLLQNSSSQGKEASNTLIKANVVSLKYIYSECIAAYSHIHIKKYVKLLWDFLIFTIAFRISVLQTTKTMPITLQVSWKSYFNVVTKP